MSIRKYDFSVNKRNKTRKSKLKRWRSSMIIEKTQIFLVIKEWKQEVQKTKTQSTSKNYLKKAFAMFPKEIRGSNFTNIEVQYLLQNQESQIKNTKKFNFSIIKGLYKNPEVRI